MKANRDPAQRQEVLIQVKVGTAAVCFEYACRAREGMRHIRVANQATAFGGFFHRMTREEETMLKTFAIAAAQAIWPSGLPKNLPPQHVYAKVAGYVQEKHDVTIGKSHILRALGLKQT